MTDADKLISVHRLQQCLFGEPRVTVGFDTDEFALIRTQWNEAFEALDALDTKTGIVAKTVKSAKVKVICSYLQKNFLDKFGPELTMTDPAKLEEELLSIIGEPDANEKEARMRQKFNSMSRRVDHSEKFAAYLTRLNNVADKLTQNEQTKTFIVRQQFLQTLSPTEQEFLLIHGKDEDTVDKQAALLDSKRQYLVSKVNLIEQNKMCELEQGQMEIMTDMQKMKQMISDLKSEKDQLQKQLNERSISRVDEQFKSLHAAVNQIGKVAGGKIRPRITKQPKRCEKCGLPGHDKDKCFPKTRLKCYVCGEMGHTQYATMFHPANTTNTKNL